MVFSGTVLTYSFHRIFPFSFDTKQVGSGPYSWVKKHYVLTLIICAISIFFCVVSSISLTFESLCCLAPMFLLTSLYIWPSIPVGNKIVRFKDIPYVKIWTISFVISFVTVLFPSVELLGLTAYSNIDVWLLFLERFCFVVAITIPFDIRDIERDKDRGLKTLPISLGAFPSLVFSLGLLVMVLMLALIQVYVGNVLDKDHLIQLFVALLITAIIVMETKQTNNDYFFSGLVESTMLLFAIALGMA